MYTQEEQAEHRQQWLDALRSGNYQQTRGTLKYDDRFCCLGVACDISGLGEWVYTSDSKTQGYTVKDVLLLSVLPKDVMNWLGVSSSTAFDKNMINSLASLNDLGYGFNDIAKVIENGNIALVSDS